MEKYIFDQSNGLWYELQGDYYIPCLVLDEAGTSPIGMWGRKHQQYLKAQDQIAWVGAMNNIRNRAEEIMLQELIYGEDAV